VAGRKNLEGLVDVPLAANAIPGSTERLRLTQDNLAVSGRPLANEQFDHVVDCVVVVFRHPDVMFIWPMV
jgi:hypothetical protein